MPLPFVDVRWSISVWNRFFFFHIVSFRIEWYRSIAMSKWANLDVDSSVKAMLVDRMRSRKLTLSYTIIIVCVCVYVVNQQKVQLCHKQQIYRSSCHRYRKAFTFAFALAEILLHTLLFLLSSRPDLMFQRSCLWCRWWWRVILYTYSHWQNYQRFDLKHVCRTVTHFHSFFSLPSSSYYVQFFWWNWFIGE